MVRPKHNGKNKTVWKFRMIRCTVDHILLHFNFQMSYTSVKFKPRVNDLCGSCYKRNKVLTCKFQLYVASAQVTLQTTFTHTLEAEWCLPYGSILPFPFPVKLTAILSSFSKGLIKAMLGLYLLLTSPVVLLLSFFFLLWDKQLNAEVDLCIWWAISPPKELQMSTYYWVIKVRSWYFRIWCF